MRDVTDIMGLLRMDARGRVGVGKSVYQIDFEEVLLKRSEEFYKEEAEGSLQSFDASTYLRLVSWFPNVDQKLGN